MHVNMITDMFYQEFIIYDFIYIMYTLGPTDSMQLLYVQGNSKTYILTDTNSVFYSVLLCSCLRTIIQILSRFAL